MEGSYNFPTDSHEATKDLLAEIAEIRKIIPKDSVPDLITKDMWQERWEKAKETTGWKINKGNLK